MIAHGVWIPSMLLTMKVGALNLSGLPRIAYWADKPWTDTEYPNRGAASAMKRAMSSGLADR